jgi:CelD/BcsL family acetyltransferase involved in cellulose biosynthesis
LPAQYEQVEARVDAKFRQNLRRRRRRLAEHGKVTYVQVAGKDANELDCALADFFVIEASGWKGRGGTAIAQRPELVGFYTQIARDASKRGALTLGFLEVNNHRVAAHLSLVHAGRHYLLKLGYDESFHEYSPGQQLTSEMIRDSCRRGLVEFDFLGPCMDWKLDWEPALRDHTWLTIFRPTRAGRLVHEARYTAWPVARAVAGRLRGVLRKEGRT